VEDQHYRTRSQFEASIASALEQRAVLDRLARALLQWETLQGAELERVFTGDLAPAR
jgi:hypothetical protein